MCQITSSHSVCLCGGKLYFRARVPSAVRLGCYGNTALLRRIDPQLASHYNCMFLRPVFSKQTWASVYDIQWIIIDLMIWYWSLVCGLLTNNSKSLFITNAFSDYLKVSCVLFKYFLLLEETTVCTPSVNTVALSKRCFVCVRIKSTWHRNTDWANSVSLGRDFLVVLPIADVFGKHVWKKKKVNIFANDPYCNFFVQKTLFWMNWINDFSSTIVQYYFYLGCNEVLLQIIFHLSSNHFFNYKGEMRADRFFYIFERSYLLL